MPFTFFTRFKYFNPRSHERSDHTQFAKIPLSDISIHAPTRGATSNQVYMYDRKEFQSTLPREERHKTISSIIESKYFNPRSHERSDPSVSSLILLSSYFNPRSHERSDEKYSSDNSPLSISIHAPTRGATLKLPVPECDYEFQSTLPREERL